MGQHDYSIANAAGASFRSDVNDALAAIVSSNSGNSAPATTFPYMFWADTTNAIMKRRKADNSGWVIGDTLAETFVNAKAAGYTLVMPDHQKVFDCSASLTLAFTAAATLGDGWTIGLRVRSGVTVVLDPSGSEQIDAATTLSVVGPATCQIVCTGAAFYTIGLNATENGTQTLANKTLSAAVLSGTTTLSGDISVGGTGRLLSTTLSTPGTVAFWLRDGNAREIASFYSGSDTVGYNGANTAMSVREATGTARSINAAGTINASGADYAEYECKRADCGAIAKGAIVGFDIDGLITDRWSLAVTFGVKSTAPSYVGGDTWGRPDDICPLDGAPIGERPTPPDGDPERKGYVGEFAAWETARAAWQMRLEAARATVDRIAYSGKVPVNVTGAVVGGYIAAVKGPGDSIVGVPTSIRGEFSVGRVRRILPDGRALIVVAQ